VVEIARQNLRPSVKFKVDEFIFNVDVEFEASSQAIDEELSYFLSFFPYDLGASVKRPLNLASQSHVIF